MSIFSQASLVQIPRSGKNISALKVPPGVKLYRIFRFPGADWDPPPIEYRNGRVDPPAGKKSAFSALYLGESLITAAFETRVIRVSVESGTDQPYFVEEKYLQLPPRRCVAHETIQPSVFINFEDRVTAQQFGLDPHMPVDRISKWQSAALAVYESLDELNALASCRVAGVCYQSKHRGSNGWNFALFHGGHNSILSRGQALLLTPSMIEC